MEQFLKALKESEKDYDKNTNNFEEIMNDLDEALLEYVSDHKNISISMINKEYNYYSFFIERSYRRNNPTKTELFTVVLTVHEDFDGCIVFIYYPKSNAPSSIQILDNDDFDKITREFIIDQLKTGNITMDILNFIQTSKNILFKDRM